MTCFPRLRERRNQRAKTLSGGEQQMLAIGRGLMTNPDCLIMDEPSEGLAPIIIQGVWEAIGKLKERPVDPAGRAERALALKLVDYVHVMSKGQVVYSAPGSYGRTTRSSPAISASESSTSDCRCWSSHIAGVANRRA